MGGATLEKKLIQQYKMPPRDLLVHYHHERLMTVQSMAKEFNCARGTVNSLMERLGVERRSQSEALKLWWENATEEQRKAQVSAAHDKNKEMAESGELSFQRVWREEPERMREQASNNALKTCKNRKRNGMTGKTGAKHHLWKPERTHEERVKARQTEEHKTWLRAVYERDNYTCQACGYDKGGKLNAHHLNSFSDHKELRSEVSNGITLCKDCHISFHNQCGYGHNTKEQFAEFLGGVAVTI